MYHDTCDGDLRCTLSHIFHTNTVDCDHVSSRELHLFIIIIIRIMGRVQCTSVMRHSRCCGVAVPVLNHTLTRRVTRSRVVTRSTVQDENVVVEECNDVAEYTSEDRKYFSLLPPMTERVTTMKKGSGFVCFSQPLQPASFVPDIRLHMYAVENKGEDSISLVGALAPTKELCGQIQSLGKPVKHIVLPSTSPEHWIYGPALSNAFPDALVWVVPGFMQGKGVPLPGRSLLFRDAKERNVLRAMSSNLQDEEFPSGIQPIVLDVPLFIEAAIVLQEAKAVILSDTGIYLSADDPEYKQGVNTALAEAVGIWDRLGPITRVVQEKYHVQAREWCDAILAEDIETVLLSHGSPVYAPAEGAKVGLQQCFDFLYD